MKIVSTIIFATVIVLTSSVASASCSSGGYGSKIGCSGINNLRNRNQTIDILNGTGRHVGTVTQQAPGQPLILQMRRNQIPSWQQQRRSPNSNRIIR